MMLHSCSASAHNKCCYNDAAIAACLFFWLAAFTLGATTITHPSEIDQALTTLHAFGIRGIDGLCHLGGEDDNSMHAYPIPKCILIDSLEGINKPTHHHGLRKRILLEEGANYVDGVTIGGHTHDNMKFYLINIIGATLSILVVCVISAMFLGFLTLDPLDIQVKMRAAIDP